MRITKRYINKSLYDTLESMTYGEAEKYIINNICSDFEICGYGYYGNHQLAEDENGKYITYLLGDSCD